MANPFKSGDGSNYGSGGAMQPGETKTLFAREKDGVTIIKTYTLTRTTRPYVEDLRDAYNADLDGSPIKWVVTPGGELKLTQGLEWSRANLSETKRTMEAERRRFNAARGVPDERRDAA